MMRMVIVSMAMMLRMLQMRNRTLPMRRVMSDALMVSFSRKEAVLVVGSIVHEL